MTATQTERWHFQIDGKRYGPVEAHDLERFLAPPRLCRFLEVQKEGSDDWISIGPHDDLSTALKRLGVVQLPQAPAPEARPVEVPERKPAPVVQEPEPVALRGPGPIALLRYWLAEWADRLAEFVIRLRIPIALVALWGAVNFGIHIYGNLSFVSEREILGEYTAVWDEYIKLKRSETTNEQWKSFGESSNRRLTPVVEKLKTRTDAETPIRRHLLWAGRDCLIPLVSSGGEGQERVEVAFRQHLNAIEQLLKGESSQPMAGAPTQ